MKLNDILSNNFNASEWEAKGYELPKYDISAVAKKTHEEPTWVHFGAGNIFRAFPAAILNDALNTGKYDRGVIVVESFDYEIIDKAYRPYNNLSLLVSLQSNGTIEKKVTDHDSGGRSVGIRTRIWCAGSEKNKFCLHSFSFPFLFLFLFMFMISCYDFCFCLISLLLIHCFWFPEDA